MRIIHFLNNNIHFLDKMDNKTRIFEFIYRNYERGYNVNQISKLVNISVGSAFKILKKLQKNGYVVVKKEKNAIYYYIKLNSSTRDMYYRLVSDINKGNKKKTKIIGTIGPSSRDSKILRKLIDAGMDCVRINASHCDENSALEFIHKVRNISKEIPILLDIPGPKIRLFNLVKPIYLKKEDKISFPLKKSKNSSLVIESSLYKYVKKGHRIFIDDGKIELLVLKSDRSNIVCRVMNDGVITKNKGLNFPDSFVDYGDMSERDKSWIKFAIKNNIDFIGTSFVRSPEDIRKLNKLLGYGSLADVIGDRPKVIAKIETKDAIKNHRAPVSTIWSVFVILPELKAFNMAILFSL